MKETKKKKKKKTLKVLEREKKTSYMQKIRNQNGIQFFKNSRSWNILE